MQSIWMLFVFLCASFRGNVIMTHTLTGFMELMDHGIVSWENLSSVFIKKVLFLPVCLLFCHRFFFFFTDCSGTFSSYSHHLPPFSPSISSSSPFRLPASSTPCQPMHQYSRCPWTSWRAWCWAATASSCRSKKMSLWRDSSLTSRCK